MNISQNTLKMFLLFLIFIVGLTIAAFIILIGNSGHPKPYLDDSGKVMPESLSEKIFILIGGIKQGMIIKSKDTSHPVLLYLHGGMPDYFLTRKYPTGLEDYFTMVWWEQRGSGISFNPDTPSEKISPTQLINDILELTDYLRQRFGQDKIYLMGHSGGTFTGIQAAAKAPDRFHAYLAVAQISNQLESEKLACQYMIEQYKQMEKWKMVRQLEATPVIEATPLSYLKIRDQAMHQLGVGTIHQMHSIFTGIVLSSLSFPEYTVKEKINIWRAKSQSGVASLWPEILSTDLTQKLTQVDLPLYFFSGVFDYTVSYTLSKAYFDKIQAPLKGFYTFNQSAHSPLFEEPEKMQQIMREDVLMGLNQLSDQ
ncbi:MAG: alpha/beta hydrolase [Candidatus Cyclobacteriaceae bacterium M3_2C_046]